MLLIETDIQTKILTSEEIPPEQKNQFLNLISYFTPMEIEELRLLL